MSLKIIHTADWHLGHTFFQHSRIEEQQLFVDWLLGFIDKENIDAIIIAGDIFDTYNPAIEAINLYHYFLLEVYKRGIQAVIVGGNHDSAPRLNSYKDIFKILNVSVVGGDIANVGDIIPIYNKITKKTEAVVVAVPYLRDGDIRKITEGETFADAQGLFINELKNHYNNLLFEAKNNFPNLPIIGTAHLYIRDAVVSDRKDNKMHQLVGTLGQVPSSIFSKDFDYIALGHIHKPQIIKHPDNVVVKYSGSPIPLNFGEREDSKEITTIIVSDNQTSIQTTQIPLQRRLIRFEGTEDQIIQEIVSLEESKKLSDWIEIILTEKTNFNDFKQTIDAICNSKNIEILFRGTNIESDSYASIRDKFVINNDINPLEDVENIFRLKCINKNIDEDTIEDLIPLFREVVDEINNEF